MELSIVFLVAEPETHAECMQNVPFNFSILVLWSYFVVTVIIAAFFFFFFLLPPWK